jgi:hypothetical protein
MGSSIPLSCKPGTFNPDEGKAAYSDCTDCTAGWYCAGSDAPAPTAKCSAGFYCPTGSKSPTEKIVEPGYYSLEGAKV